MVIIIQDWIVKNCEINQFMKNQHQIYYRRLKIVIIILLLCMNWNQWNQQDLNEYICYGD